MSNVWKLFCNDVKRLTSNVVTGIIVLGLVLLPSIFSWYNIIACWDVFANTGNLSVAVANTDEGYESDLIPIKVNIGEQVVSALRENDQLNWTFTSEEDAIDGASSGRYYAAVVLPPSFSKDMMTFYAADVEHAQIVYYTNEKKSAVAPKVTDQGADQVSYQVNKVFAEKLSEIALGVSSALSKYVDTADTNGSLANLASHVDTMSTQMSQAASVLTTYSSIMGSSQSLVDGSFNLLTQAKGAVNETGAAVGEGRQAVSTIADALSAASDSLSTAFKESSATYADLLDTVDGVFGSTDSLATDSATQLRDQAAAVDGQIVEYQNIADQLEQMKPEVSDEYKPVIDALVAQLDASIAMQGTLRDALNQAADDIESGNAEAQSKHNEVRDLVAAAQKSVDDLAANYETDIKPSMDRLMNGVTSLVASMENSAQKLDAASTNLLGPVDSVSGSLTDAQQKLDDAATNLSVSSEKLATLSQVIMQSLSNGDVQQLRQILSSDPTTLATALSAPVQLDRQAVFPANNFGSQMAPLYTTLAIWIGSLLLVVAIRVVVSRKAEEQLDKPTLSQMFLGRFGVFAILSFLQTTCMALGNMLFLGVQVSDPLLYLVCFWLAGLVFTFLIYSLVVSFANLGKAIAVLLLIVQVTAGGGSFPLVLLPTFFQVLSPYLPATHVINAMRAAMMGVYGNDFWINIGQLLLFIIPAALLGLVLRKPLMKFLGWYVEKVEDSKLVA